MARHVRSRPSNSGTIPATPVRRIARAAPSASMPATVSPMLAKAAALPQPDEAYGYEIKWDGIRAICFLECGRIRLQSRNLLDLTTQYPELHGLTAVFPARRLVLDGEIIALDERGVPSFQQLQGRMGVTGSVDLTKRMRVFPVTYMIFDLLYADGVNLMSLPYSERRTQLALLNLDGAYWQLSMHYVGNGAGLLRAAHTHGFEGILAKKLDSPYEPGMRNGNWLKIKLQRRQEFVIAGWQPGEGSRHGTIGSLLLGVYDRTASDAARANVPQRLIYAGKAGSGFTDSTLLNLHAMLQPLRRDTSPFEPRKGMPRGVVFVEPRYVGEFEFTEFTRDNVLRHPAFKGLRLDKDARDVIREPLL